MLVFAPDLDPLTPEILTAVENVIPTRSGYAALESPTVVGLPALAAAAINAASVLDLSNNKRVIAGTDTKLYDGSGGSSWVDVSRVGSYTAGEKRWRFAQFGNISLAANGIDVIQSWNGTGSFANIAGSPKCKLLATVGQFVMAANITDAAVGEPNSWYCSAIADYTNWTPSVATQCAKGQLLDVPGDITSLRRLGDYAVAYKERGIHLGQYVGPPFVWAWQTVPVNFGAFSHESVVSIGPAHFFIGQDDFYRFDGSQPISIGAPIREWFFGRLSKPYRNLIQGIHDAHAGRVFWHYPSSSATVDSWVCYDYVTDRWSAGTLTIECALEYISGGYTYETIQNIASTYGTFPDVSYGSPFWSAYSTLPAFFDAAHVLKSLSGTPGASSLTSGDMGDDAAYTLLQRITPHFITDPPTATLTHYGRATSGASLSSYGPVSINAARRFDLLKSARFHRVKLDCTGAMEITRLRPQLASSGFE
jgi:hypothetical protein